MLEVDAWKVHTDVLATNSDTGAVGLVDDTVNLLEVVRVGDDLVAGDDILLSRVSTKTDDGMRGWA